VVLIITTAVIEYFYSRVQSYLMPETLRANWLFCLYVITTMQHIKLLSKIKNIFSFL